jgi:glycosyltransferase involved in cell wall biosynthesis
MMRLSIIIPCFNEEHNIPELTGKCIDLLNYQQQLEVILVNNGSTDNTAEILERLIQESGQKRLRLINIEKNIGYGHGILVGLDAATSDVLAWTHADLQTDPIDVIHGFQSFLEGPSDLVIKGKRLGRSLPERFFSAGLSLVVFIMLGERLDDINGQPKIFSRDFFLKFLKGKAPLDFSLDLFFLLVARRSGLPVHEVPVSFSKRKADQAKGGGSFKTRLKLIFRTFNFIRKLRGAING